MFTSQISVPERSGGCDTGKHELINFLTCVDSPTEALTTFNWTHFAQSKAESLAKIAIYNQS